MDLITLVFILLCIVFIGVLIRFFFFSNEGGEPAHIHVQRDEQLAKFWAQTVALAASTGFPAHELRKLEGIVQDNQQRFLEA